jgi:iron complex outermembrane receptor protein
LLGDNFIQIATEGELRDKKGWSSFDPRIALDYKVNDDIMVYANVSKGYKTGGFNSQPDRVIGAPGTAVPAPVDEETNTAYELGFKSTLLNGRLQLNVAAFLNDYKDLQLELQSGAGLVLIDNAEGATTKGIEVDSHVLLSENFDMRFTYAYLDSSFDKGTEFASIGDVSGNDLPRAPRNTASIVARYTYQMGSLGELSIRGDWIYTDDQFFEPSNSPLFMQEAYSIFNARLGFEHNSGKWGINLIGENLGDEEYYVHKAEFLTVAGIPGLQRLWRVELTGYF